jgi:hypothetical protein
MTNLKKVNKLTDAEEARRLADIKAAQEKRLARPEGHFRTEDDAYERVMEAAIPLFRAIVLWLQFAHLNSTTERPSREKILWNAVLALQGIAHHDAFSHDRKGDEEFYRYWIERDKPLPAVVETE